MDTSIRQKTATGMPVIHISDAIYEKIARELFDNAVGMSQYSGTVEYKGTAFRGELSATLIVYHKTVDYPEGRAEFLSDLIPIWWEFHTWFEDGEENANDFSFQNIKQYLN